MSFYFFLVCFGSNSKVILHKSSSTTIHRQHFSVDPFRLFAREETHGVSDIQRVATSVEWRGIGSGLREEKKKLASCKVLETRKKRKKGKENSPPSTAQSSSSLHQECNDEPHRGTYP